MMSLSIINEMRRWFWVILLGMLLSACGERGTGQQKPSAETAQEVEDTPGFSGKNAYIHCAALCDLGPRPTGSAAYAAQVDYIVRSLDVMGWHVQRDHFSPFPGCNMVNLRAVFSERQGRRPLLVSCHIDTKGGSAILGADDGASGAAVLLELARVLARNVEVADQVELIFFDGEESLGERITETDGLYGSRYDVARRGVAGLPACMINMDMVGGAGKVIAVPIMDTVPAMCNIYMEAVRQLGFSQDRWTYHMGSYWDDHRPYMEAGVPTLNMIASFMGSNWWHSKRDNMQRISAASLEESGQMSLKIIELILDKLQRGE